MGISHVRLILGKTDRSLGEKKVFTFSSVHLKAKKRSTQKVKGPFWEHLCIYQSDTVDGLNPKQPPGMYKTL